MSATAPVDVLLVDDHPLFSRGLELLLLAEAPDDVRVVGRVEDAAQAVAEALRLGPALVVVDLAMPAPGGLAVVRGLRRQLPGVTVLVLSGTTAESDALDALRAGASGFVPKSSDPATLVAPVLAAARGWGVLPPALLSRLLGGHVSGAAALREQLDGQELALWRLVTLGRGHDEVARELFVSERTAKRLVAALLHRLGVGTRLEAAALGGRAGLLDDGCENPAP